MTPTQTFLPKDRDGALQVLKDMLYKRMDAVQLNIGGEPRDNWNRGADDQRLRECMFIRNLLDIIERS